MSQNQLHYKEIYKNFLTLSVENKILEAASLLDHPDLNRMELLITRDDAGSTILHKLIEYGRDLFALLILRYPNPDVEVMRLMGLQDNEGLNVLHVAAKFISRSLYDILSNDRIDLLELLGTQDKSGKTPLHKIAKYGKKEDVEAVLNACGEGLNELLRAQDNLGNMPIHKAAEYNNQEAITAILSNPNVIDPISLLIAQNKLGETPLEATFKEGYVNAIKFDSNFFEILSQSRHFELVLQKLHSLTGLFQNNEQMKILIYTIFDQRLLNTSDEEPKFEFNKEKIAKLEFIEGLLKSNPSPEELQIFYNYIFSTALTCPEPIDIINLYKNAIIHLEVIECELEPPSIAPTHHNFALIRYYVKDLSPQKCYKTIIEALNQHNIYAFYKESTAEKNEEINVPTALIFGDIPLD